jgi:glutamine cyclotransferase
MSYINMEKTMPLYFTVIALLGSALAAATKGFCDGKSTQDMVLRSIDTPTPNITGAAHDGKYLWVADWKEDILYRIDPASGKTIESLPSPGPTPTGLAWDGSHLWVADLHFNKAYRINVEKKTVVWEIPLPGSYPFGMAWDGKFLWLSDRNSKQIMKISPTDGAIFHDIESPGGEITGITFFKGYLWAANRIDDEIYMMDPEKGWVINVFKSPGPYAWGLASDGAVLINADYNDGKIYFLRTEPEKKPWMRSGKKDYSLEFTLDFYNYGKDAVAGGEMLVALPEARENQEILQGPLYDPQPDSVVKTGIGQKYAIWSIKNLAAPARKRVTAKWEVSLFDTDWVIFPDKVQGEGSIPASVKKIYLADGEKYLVGDPFIAKTVKETAGGEKNLYVRARKLYEWVIDRMEYKLAGGWETGPKVLGRGSGSCSEYTFAFISLCRAAGIPARFVGSIVVRKDDSSVDDVFHRWAEIYLPPYGWIPVDANHGDKPDARGRALGFGHLTGNVLVTTVEGAFKDNKLGWGYNYEEHHTYQGEANTYLEGIGFWRPLHPGAAGAVSGKAKSGAKVVCECGL